MLDATGLVHLLAPPTDVLAELSSQVYGLLPRKIGHADRKLYQGVPGDNGWALLRHLRNSQADEGGHYDMLDSQRQALRCDGFADYAAFKSTVLQLYSDFAQALIQGLIRPDKAWPLSVAKNKVSGILGQLLGSSLADWLADVANINAALV